MKFRSEILRRQSRCANLESILARFHRGSMVVDFIFGRFHTRRALLRSVFRRSERCSVKFYSVSERVETRRTNFCSEKTRGERGSVILRFMFGCFHAGSGLFYFIFSRFHGGDGKYSRRQVAGDEQLTMMDRRAANHGSEWGTSGVSRICRELFLMERTPPSDRCEPVQSDRLCF